MRKEVLETRVMCRTCSSYCLIKKVNFRSFSHHFSFSFWVHLILQFWSFSWLHAKSACMVKAKLDVIHGEVAGQNWIWSFLMWQFKSRLCQQVLFLFLVTCKNCLHGKANLDVIPTYMAGETWMWSLLITKGKLGCDLYLCGNAKLHFIPTNVARQNQRWSMPSKQGSNSKQHPNKTSWIVQGSLGWIAQSVIHEV